MEIWGPYLCSQLPVSTPFYPLTNSISARERERERDTKNESQGFPYSLSPTHCITSCSPSISFLYTAPHLSPSLLRFPPANRQEKVLLVSPRSSCYGLSLPHWTILSSVPKKHPSLSLTSTVHIYNCTLSHACPFTFTCKLQLYLSPPSDCQLILTCLILS